jgi:hypothetical protein
MQNPDKNRPPTVEWSKGLSALDRLKHKVTLSFACLIFVLILLLLMSWTQNRDAAASLTHTQCQGHA